MTSVLWKYINIHTQQCRVSAKFPDSPLFLLGTTNRPGIWYFSSPDLSHTFGILWTETGRDCLKSKLNHKIQAIQVIIRGIISQGLWACGSGAMPRLTDIDWPKRNSRCLYIFPEIVQNERWHKVTSEVSTEAELELRKFLSYFETHSVWKSFIKVSFYIIASEAS